MKLWKSEIVISEQKTVQIRKGENYVGLQI